MQRTGIGTGATLAIFVGRLSAKVLRSVSARSATTSCAKVALRCIPLVPSSYDVNVGGVVYIIEIVIAEAACDRVNGGGASAVHIDTSTERKHPGRRWLTHVTAMSENNKRKPEEVFSELAPSCRKSKLHCTRTHRDGGDKACVRFVQLHRLQYYTGAQARKMPCSA